MGEDVAATNPALLSLYDQILSRTLLHLQDHRFQVDNFLSALESDTRRGLTLLFRPPQEFQAKLSSILAELQAVCPGQYAYPSSDWHTTVLSIISCFPRFQLDHIDAKTYCEVLTQCLKAIPPFKVELRGLTCSAGAVMIQGFFTPGTLNVIRQNIRQAFQSTDLHQTIDQRYVLETAHITILRFQQPVTNPKPLLDYIQQYRNSHYGTFTVNTLELVYNDWYQRQSSTTPIQSFPLTN